MKIKTKEYIDMKKVTKVFRNFGKKGFVQKYKEKSYGNAQNSLTTKFANAIVCDVDENIQRDGGNKIRISEIAWLYFLMGNETGKVTYSAYNTDTVDQKTSIIKSINTTLKKFSDLDTLIEYSKSFKENEPNAFSEITQSIFEFGEEIVELEDENVRDDVENAAYIIWKYFLIGYESAKQTYSK